MAGSSVITEEIKEMIGKDLAEPTAREVTAEAIRRFARAIDDPNPLWHDEEYARGTRYGGIIAPPVFLVSLWAEGKNTAAMLEKMTSLECPLKRVLNGGQEYEYFQPVRPGDVITVTAKLTDAQEREGKGGTMVTLFAEVSYTNQRGELVAKERVIAIRY